MAALSETIIFGNDLTGSQDGKPSLRAIIAGGTVSLSNVNFVSGSTLTSPFTGSVNLTEPITGSVGITGPITGSVSITEPITGSVGITGPITGSVSITEPITGSVGITGPITGSVSITEPIVISGGSVSIAGSITGSITGSVGITGPITGSVGITGPITGSVGITGPVAISGGSVSITGAITGSVGITGPITGSVGITGPVAISGGSVNIVGAITGSVTGSVGITGPITGSVGITSAVTVQQEPRSQNLALDVQPFLVNFPSSQRGAFGIPLAQTEHPVVNLTFNYSINPYFVITGSTNSGIVTSSLSHARLYTGTNASGSAYFESRTATQYVPGQGVTSRFTAIFGTGTQNSIQEIGHGDDTDGLFFMYSGSSFGVCRRSRGIDNFISQSAWNGYDKFDGQGPSGVILDTNKGNVYQVKFQWLGYGAIRFFIEDPHTQELCLVHTIRYANTAQDVTIANPTLPLRARIANLGNTTNLQLATPSMGSFLEGPHTHAFAPGATGSFKSVTTEAAIFTIKNVATFQGSRNRVRVSPSAFSVAALNTPDVQFRLILNTTLGGSPNFQNFAANSSVVQVDTAATTATGGRVIFQTRIPGNSGRDIQQGIDGITLVPGDTLTVTAQSTGASADVSADLVWRELFGG